jgi:hypothetical protein
MLVKRRRFDLERRCERANRDGAKTFTVTNADRRIEHGISVEPAAHAYFFTGA